MYILIQETSTRFCVIVKKIQIYLDYYYLAVTRLPDLINMFLVERVQHNLWYFPVNIFLFLIYFTKYLSRILNTTYLLTTFYFQHQSLETQEDIMTFVWILASRQVVYKVDSVFDKICPCENLFYGRYYIATDLMYPLLL